MKGYDIKSVKIIRDENPDVEELLTGEYLAGLPADSDIPVNAEVEDDEYIKFPDGNVQEAEGYDHKDGGVKVNIPDGTKIVSKSLYLTKEQVKKLEKEYELKLSTKDSYAEVIEKYTKKIGLEKLNDEQEDFFENLKKEQEKKIDKSTSRVNTDYLSGRISEIENSKKPLERDRADFYEKVFQMQENSKPKSEKDETFKYGGVSKKNFEAACAKLGIDPKTASSTLQGVKKFPGGGIFVDSKDKWPTGGDLSQEQKDQLIKYYKRHNPEFIKSIETGKNKWENQVFNPGLIEDLKTVSPDKIAVNYQPLDKKTGRVASGTYGDLSDQRVDGFVLKPYFESRTKRPFSSATNADIKQIQEEYDRDITGVDGVNYYSGVKGQTEVSDGYIGNRTSSYVRRNVKLKADKEGTIDVDMLWQKTPEEVDLELKDYGLTYKDIEHYKNAATKYIQVGPDGVVDPPIIPEKELDKSVGADGRPLKDNVTANNTPGKEYPRLFFTPDQSAIPPSAMEAHLKGDIRLQRVDPIRIGIDQTLQGVADQRNFVAEQVSTLPESQRAAVLANLAANSQKTISEATTQANTTNAQNLSQAELFNINQAGQEQSYAVNNALSFEQRQLTAKANTEEAMQQYYDYNKRVNINNFENNQKLNLMDSLYPDFDLDFMGSSVSYNPKSDWTPFISEDYKVFETDADGKQVEVTKTRQRKMTAKELETQKIAEFANAINGAGMITK